ncbi:uncharacterized membrane protein YjjP (DUF1212 family) [Aeriscardovia aeriphila]|uniref:Threonine/serine exporter n=1 Tax=Aeriscardovia aeriphila TaxID=218139 RepID=A0A261F8U6_9BIFI|nr:uncharacterized membrane protein YjjP (DUF1212 family) [Aeriscardovia aeriphila]OZG55316.1 hypothetical protein AEAE_1113 [Aeriscardovia aeriphila]
MSDELPETSNANQASSSVKSILPAGDPAVSKYHTHSVPLDMDDVEKDWDTPIAEAGIAAKASVIMRVGAMDLASGTGSFRVREMMHRIAYPLGVHVRADVNLTDIEASYTDGRERITDVIDLPTTGVNTERIWLLEHFADWFSVNLGKKSMYHKRTEVSQELMEHLEVRDASQFSADVAKKVERKAKKGGKLTRDQQLDKEYDDASATGEAANRADPIADPERGMTVGQAHRRLDMIEHRKPLYGPALAGFASACACASFVFLLGGGPYDMLGAFVGAGLGHWLRRRLFAHRLNQFFVTFVCVALAALACTGTLRLLALADPTALHHDTAYIGAMLFVIPGFPLITGGLDMAKIDFPSGVQRLAYVFCIILMATLAGWMVATIVHLNPQGFEPQNLDPWVKAILRMVFAFIGVWGFSMMFNSPQRMCFVAGCIGAITDALRLELTDFGVSAEMAAFLGALLAGLLASAWRTSVRRGWLPVHMGYPRICLTVPSIVIMVPGMYMYRAMFYLGQFSTLQALDWMFRAFMVIICLPIGLAMARVLTDGNWRYDN